MLVARIASACLIFRVLAHADDDFERAPVSYSDTAAHDAITKLQARLNARDLVFAGNERATVRALLRELRVPESSQLLVFSKTSLQRTRISPENPRAIYFSDTCYVAWVPGGLVEIAAIDAQLGPIFYAFDPLERGTEPQRFRRDSNCLSCHANTFTRDIPGVFARSMFIEATGSPIFRGGSELVDFTTPFEKRWGGWYVTGRHGSGRHRGNSFAREAGDEIALDTEAGANLESLAKFIDPEDYLAPTSDIGALMIFEHQLAVHQALTRANFDCRRMLAYQRGLQESLAEPLTEHPVYDSVKGVFARSTEAILDAILYRNEAAMPAGGIQGSADFRREYEAAGPGAADGRTLRTLDFRTRLARLRCSPQIYSEQFRGLPAPLLGQLLTRLGRILTGEHPDARYAYLDADERREISEILKDSAKDLTALW